MTGELKPIGGQETPPPIQWRLPAAHADGQADLDRTFAAVAQTLGVGPNEVVRLPLPGILARHAARTPRHAAIVAPDMRMSWAELNERVRRLGRAIAARAPAGGAVAVLLPDGWETLIGVLACAAAARVALVLNANHPPSRNAAILAQAGAVAVLVHDAAIAPELPAGMLRISPLADGGDAALPPPLPQDGPAFVIYTSGSTGAPKGIALALGSALHWLCCTLRGFAVGRADVPHVTMVLFPLAAFAGLHAALSALICGGCVLLPAGASPIPLMLAERPTRLMALPAIVRTLIAAPDAAAAFSGMRVVRIGGEAELGAEIARWYAHLPEGCVVQNGYGQTEASISIWNVPRGFDEPGTAPIGMVRPKMQFAVLDEDGRAVPDGEVGVLHVRSRHVALGEWRDGACQPGRMRPDPQAPDHRILDTGDLVQVRGDGTLSHRGRADRQIKVRGMRIEPAEIEAALRGVPGVTDAAVAARKARGDTEVLAFIVAGNPDAAMAARARLAASLPAPMRPRRIVQVQALPRLPGGKLDTLALLAMPEAAAAPVAADPVSGARRASAGAERAVAHAWKRVLATPPRPGITFADASGDSLRLLEFVLLLESRVGRRLRLEAFDAEATAAGMASTLDAVLAGTWPAPVARRAFMLPGVGGDMPGLAKLRADCATAAEIELLDYPGWRETVAGELSLHDIAEAAAAHIAAAAPSGPVCLIGYSFGVFPALLAAQLLEARGRTVAQLVLIDRPTPALRWPQTHVWQMPRTPRQIWWEANRIWQLERFAAMLAWFCAHPKLRRVLRMCADWRRTNWLSRHGGALSYWCRHYVQEELRYRMTHQWAAHWAARWAAPATRLLAPLLLVRTEQHWPNLPDDLGWSAVASRVEIAKVGGTHHSMLSAAHRHAAAEAIGAALDRALNPAQPEAQPAKISAAAVASA